MRESILIKNLGPIKYMSIEHIKPFTILIGESGSGKSTLMKTLSLMRWIYKMHNIRSYLKRSKVSKSPFRFRMDTYFKQCGFEQYIQSDTEIVYCVTFDQTYTLRYSDGKLTGTSDKDLILTTDLQYTKLSFVSETRNIIPLWADKGASLAGGYLGYFFHEVYNDFIKASENIKEFEVPYLDLKLSVRKGQSGKKYLVTPKSKGYEIDLKNASSGTQNAIPVSVIAEHFSKYFNFEDAFNYSLLTFLSRNDSLVDFKPVKNLGDIHKKIFMHIEEPELSLYPDAQCELINDLVIKCFQENQNNMELIFSTHSPYIINHLNLLIKAYDTNTTLLKAKMKYEDLAVYQVEDGCIHSLLAQNERIVNTNPLSDTINSIYDQYSQL